MYFALTTKLNFPKKKNVSQTLSTMEHTGTVTTHMDQRIASTHAI